MPRKGHIEEQVIAALHQAESGVTVTEACRGLGISQATFYIWKRQCAGLGVSELRQLREENARLKRLVGDLSLDKHIPRETLTKKSEAGAAMARSRAAWGCRAGGKARRGRTL